MYNLYSRIISKNFFILVSIFILLAQPSYSDRVKDALKNLTKGQFEKVKSALDKSIAKEKINPGAKYVYSLYFIKQENKAFHLDSGYSYILRAIEDYKSLDEKAKKNLFKLKIKDSTLNAQKQTIENLGYEEANKQNTEEGFHYFVLHYPTAAQTHEAIQKRDELAYDKAKIENTSQSFNNFLQKYSQSDLSDKAKENYDLRLFEESTGTGTLMEFITFLKNNPESSYSNKADENVFKMFTLNNTKEKYEDFINQFLGSNYLNDAWTYLLYHYADEKKIADFISEYPQSPVHDKAEILLKRQDSVYYVFFDNKQFGFINELGGQLSEVRFDGVFEDYLCSGVEDEFIVFTQDDKLGAIDKTGVAILPTEFDEIEKIGTATLKVKEDKKISLHLMNGKKAFQENYDDIQKLDGTFVKVKSNGKWGMRGINGCEILKPVYDEIAFIEKNFFLIKKDKKYALLKSADLVHMAQNALSNLNFKYDYFEEINDHFLAIGKKDHIGVMDEHHTYIIPPDYHSIIFTKNSWIAKNDKGTTIFDLKGKPLPGNIYNKVIPGIGVYAVKQARLWGLLSKAGKQIVPIENDSVMLVGDNISLIKKGNDFFGLFNYSKTVQLPKYKKFEIQSSLTKAKDSTRIQYLLLEGEDGGILVYNKRGKSLLKNRYDHVTVASENLFIVEQKGKIGVVDSLDKILLPLKYDAIGNFNGGFVSLLKSSKFGIFNPSNKTLIQPKYDALIKVFDPSKKIFLAMEDGKYALIDQKDNEISEHKFKEASSWKGDTILVKEANDFYLYSIKAKSKVSDSFQSVKFIKNDNRERLALVYSNSKYGVLSNKRGFVIPLKYNDVTNLGTSDKPFYMAEHHVEEADYFVVLYINHLGKIVMSQAYKSAEYEKLLCQE